MNVLFINRMMGVSWGGGENYDYHLARALQSRGHEVTLLTGKRLGCQEDIQISGIETISVATPYLRRYMYALAGKLPLVPGLFAQLDLQLFVAVVRRSLDSILTHRKIDIIQILGIPPLAEHLARRGQPIVMRFPGPPAWFQTRQLNRIKARSNAAMFTHGDAVRHFGESLGIPVDEVPPGVDSNHFSPAIGQEERNRTRGSLGITAGDFTLITAGRLIQGKGFEFLLESAARHIQQFDPIKLVIAGDGQLRARYERMASELGIASHVRFVGHLPKESVARHLRASDAFVLFSEYENYSNAALEAMSSGIPVIASRVGGFPLQVRDGVNGFLIEPGNFQQFHERIESIRQSPRLLGNLSRGAREFAGGFSWKQCASRVEGIYARVREK